MAQNRHHQNQHHHNQDLSLVGLGGGGVSRTMVWGAEAMWEILA